jgi:protein archease
VAYRILEHTADIGIEATAPDIPSLFSEAVRAMASVELDGEPPPAFDRVAVSAEADDLAALLADVLQEALWRFAAQGWLPVDAELEVSGTTAAGTFGVVNDVTVGGPAIKAVTYHQLLVERTSGGWRAQVYFDV